jgi:hypothetical protein
MGVFFGDPYRQGPFKRFLRKLFSPRLGYDGSAASTPDWSDPSKYRAPRRRR